MKVCQNCGWKQFTELPSDDTEDDGCESILMCDHCHTMYYKKKVDNYEFYETVP